MDERRAGQGGDVNGPVFHGPAREIQIAYGNENVTQNQQINTAPAASAEHEELLALVRELLARLPHVDLAEQDREDTRAAAEDVIAEITGPEAAEPGRLRRALTMLRGALAPVATGVAAGATAGAQDWARAAIEGLAGAV
ncbi:hypothetical protein [Streptomyces sp. NPDC090025]|uniref:hypothetical protein n=1 Tax=Streptomyces sp. NPDC090025 TaxID=3365922 RepID=UPI003837CA9A